MYDIIYNEMVAAKVAEKLPQSIYCNREWNKVENIEQAFCKSQKVDTVLTYPHYVIFADETGCNTNKKMMVILLA